MNITKNRILSKSAFDKILKYPTLKKSRAQKTH